MATAKTTVKAATATATNAVISDKQKKEGAALFTEAKALAQSAKDMGKAIHSLCMKMARHAIQYRDVSAMTYFVKLLDEKSADGKNESIVRVTAVKTWFQTFGFARWTKDAKTKAEGFKLATDKLDAASDTERNAQLAKGNATPFNKFTPEAPFVPIDSFAAIEGLIKRLTNKQGESGKNSKGVIVKNNINPDHIKALESLRDQLKLPTVETLRIPAKEAKAKGIKTTKRTPKQEAARAEETKVSSPDEMAA